MKIVIIANGEASDLSVHRAIISGADYIIAADGGIFNCLANNIRPDCVIGDLDSIRTKELLLKTEAKVIHLEEQDSTDMEKALQHARQLNPAIINIFCGFGKRLDHSLGNIFILYNNKDLSLTIHDQYGTLFALDPGQNTLSGLKGTTVSLFAIERVENISLDGFKFPLDEKYIGPSFFGVSNEISGDHAVIRFVKGRLLVYQLRNGRQR